MERLSLREICEGNLEEGILYWGPWRICRKDSGEGLVPTKWLRWGSWKVDPIPGL